MLDCLVAIALPLVFCVTRHWPLGWRLALFIVLAPLAIFLSYPGCFVVGAILLAFLPALWPRRQIWWSWLLYTLVVVSTFAAFYLLLAGPVRAQRTQLLESCWNQYPDWTNPLQIPVWSVNAFLHQLVHLWRPTGDVFALMAAVGAVRLWTSHRRLELILLGVPGMLAMLASWMRAYPFESRLVLFVAGPLALLIGEGIHAITGWVRGLVERRVRFGPRRGQLAIATVLVLMAIPLGVPVVRMFTHMVRPVPRLPIEQWPESDTARGH